MIGNDIVDLAKADRESNIFRLRFLEKICSQEEIKLILSNQNSTHLYWRIWSMKESAYKAFQRKCKFETAFNPFAFSCQLYDSQNGRVCFKNESVSVQTIHTDEFIYSEIKDNVHKNCFFGSTSDFMDHLKDKLKLNSIPEFQKTKEGLPFVNLSSQILEVSKTHHGNFQAFQY
ncbi:4'-phosphopantetheinyl transferase family protein [Psychroflexus montanilacus]|uniref:4'-phosphopantetheinyl transferase family protein n=1 Tax=Psychroflexus montanilacus TaxID=2873598 RepID=UPI001CC9C4E9|nr:4'-phosphopantetheinyl transferase superfamily protein [Psychroflexus montanilacus]MBZ9651168.1 4'-phosphopantetheinyl transferase superfamily protein [Psychroflexus montanilacus]